MAGSYSLPTEKLFGTTSVAGSNLAGSYSRIGSAITEALSVAGSNLAGSYSADLVASLRGGSVAGSNLAGSYSMLYWIVVAVASVAGSNLAGSYSCHQHRQADDRSDHVDCANSQCDAAPRLYNLSFRGSPMAVVEDKVAGRAMPMSVAKGMAEQDDALRAALAKVATLDLAMLKTKICRDEGMTAEEVDEIDDLYRKFLALNIRYPDRKICPTGPIDLIWHYHILDTRAYERDCMALFGRTLHHFPYFGMRGEQDKQDLEDTFAASVELFIRHFGVDPTRGDTMARSCRSQNCP